MVEHILLILNHVLIVVPKHPKYTVANNQILSDKEIERYYDLKHTAVLNLENIILVESLICGEKAQNSVCNLIITINNQWIFN